MPVVTRSQTRSNELTQRIANLPDLLHDSIVKHIDMKTQVLISFMSDAGKSQIKRLHLQKWPSVCIHYFRFFFAITLDRNHRADYIGRFKDFSSLKAQNRTLFRLEDTYFQGITCNETDSTRFFLIITKNSTILKKLWDHFKTIYHQEIPFHFKVDVPRIKLHDLLRKMPEPIKFTSISICGNKSTRIAVRTIAERVGRPDVLHLNVENLPRSYRRFRNYNLVYIENSGWIDDPFLDELESKYVILTDVQFGDHIVFGAIENYVRHPNSPCKLFIAEMKENYWPLHWHIFLVSYVLHKYDGASRPRYFRMPAELANYVPKRFRKINLKRAYDIVRVDGSRVTVYNTRKAFIFVAW